MYRIRSGPDFKGCLTPNNASLVLIDYQVEFAGEYIPTIAPYALQLYQLGKTLNLPVAVTTLVGNNISGDLLPEFDKHIVKNDIIQRHQIDAWANEAVTQRVQNSSITKIVLAGAGADISLTQTCLNCLRENYDVYVAWDACAASTPQALEIAFTRLVQAGVIPITTNAVIAEMTGQIPARFTSEALTPVIAEPNLS